MAEKTEKSAEDLILENLDHVKLKDLKQSIGYDYSIQLQKFIKNKYGRTYTAVHIRRSLSMKGLIPKFVIYAIELKTKLESISNQEKEKDKETIQSVANFFNQ